MIVLSKQKSHENTLLFLHGQRLYPNCRAMDDNLPNIYSPGHKYLFREVSALVWTTASLVNNTKQ